MDEKMDFNDEDLKEIENSLEMGEEKKMESEGENAEHEEIKKEVENVDFKMGDFFKKFGEKYSILEKIFMGLSLLISLNILYIIFSFLKIRFRIKNLSYNLKAVDNDLEITKIYKFIDSLKKFEYSENILTIIFAITFIFLIYLIVTDGIKFETRVICKGQFITALLGSLFLLLSISTSIPNLKVFNELSKYAFEQNIPLIEGFSKITGHSLFSDIKILLLYSLALFFWATTFYLMYLKIEKKKQIRITI